jgi:hypothetical protein
VTLLGWNADKSEAKDSGMLATEEFLEKASKTRSAGNDINARDLVLK